MAARLDMLCKVCGSVLSCVTYTCVRGEYCKPLKTLPGMENAPAERAQALAEAEGEELTQAMRQPKADISAKAGRIEREAPLFFGTGENPTLFNQEG